MRFALVIILTVLLAVPAFAGEFAGRVVGVIDGDTIDVLHDGQTERIRLNGIDTPEKGQDYGRRAKQFAEDFLAKQEVRVLAHGADKYGRTIGDVFLSDGTHLNKELVKAGLAWWYCRHSSDESLKQLEEEARDAKRGLWKDPVPIPPWVYRKLQRKQVPDVSDFDCPGQTVSRALESASTESLASSVIGNRRSHIFHRADCPGYGKVSAGNRVTFESIEAAEEAGYRLAGNCP
ncbi:thermonuclease family protein [Nitrospira lenta]|uniref:Nuclease (SNase domain-containing protein) n=1 Tax=Nitrospira lenta TaxID=1436998 RepID=A0A330L4H7_9BACT|nr:thermonuclease family protein [Nitrospira lenta]SPP64734.1 Nuclease (SNase domain-containing protein) [Nitrospira lenta]